MKLTKDCRRHGVQTHPPPDYPHLLAIVMDLKLLNFSDSQRATHDFSQVSNALYHLHCESVLWETFKRFWRGKSGLLVIFPKKMKIYSAPGS